MVRGHIPGDVAIVVIAKEPRPGRSKTRLCPPCTPTEAAYLAEAALVDTLAAVTATTVTRRVLALDGAGGSWLPAGFRVIRQRGETLADRLGAVFEDVAGPALVVAMDTPQVTSSLLEASVAALARMGTDAVLGAACDGGYWAIGLREADRRVFAGIPMSTHSTADAQRERLKQLGLTTRELAVLRDVDNFESALTVAAESPISRFATAVRSLRPHEFRES